MQSAFGSSVNGDFGWGWNAATQPLQSGLQMHQVQRLAQDAMDEKFTDINVQGSQSQTIGRLGALTQDGKEQIPVSLQWADGRHRILVTKVEGDRVYFRNPWGHRDQDKRGARMPGVDHRVGDNGIESIPVKDFQQRMASVLVPDRLLS
jgi:hypothetical protein